MPPPQITCHIGFLSSRPEGNFFNLKSSFDGLKEIMRSSSPVRGRARRRFCCGFQWGNICGPFFLVFSTGILIIHLFKMIRTESAHICQISDFGVGDQARIDPPFGPCLLFWESLRHTNCRFRKPLVDFSQNLFSNINWTRYLQIPQVDLELYFQYLVRYREHS